MPEMKTYRVSQERELTVRAEDEVEAVNKASALLSGETPVIDYTEIPRVTNLLVFLDE